MTFAARTWLLAAGALAATPLAAQTGPGFQQVKVTGHYDNAIGSSDNQTTRRLR